MSTNACGSCGAPMPDGGPLCVEEARALAASLRTVPELLADLEVTLTRQDRLGGGDGGRRSTDTPVPWKEQVPDVVWALGNVVTTWARDLAEQRRIPLDTGGLWRHPRRDWSDPIGPMRPVPPDPLTSLAHAAAWLADHWRALRALDDAVQAHDEITDAVASARFVVDRPAELRFAGVCEEPTEVLDEHGKPVPCPRELYVRPGVTLVECTSCGTEHDVDRLRLRLLERLDDEVASYVEVSRAVSWLAGRAVSVNTIKTWVGRDELVVARWLHRRAGERPIMVHARRGPKDTPLVRVGDVLQLLTLGPRKTRQRRAREAEALPTERS